MKKEAGKKDNQWKENLAVSAILSVLSRVDIRIFVSPDVEVDFIRVPFKWVFTVLKGLEGSAHILCLLPEIT